MALTVVLIQFVSNMSDIKYIDNSLDLVRDSYLTDINKIVLRETNFSPNISH